jgi:hypothetical protein
MNRRSFFALTMLLPLSYKKIYAKSFCSQSDSENKIFEFLKSFEAKTQNVNSLKNTILETLYQKELDAWRKMGFVASGSNYYELNAGKMLMFPLEICHEKLGTLETALLVFEKNSNKEFQKLKTISGLHITAIQNAMNDLVGKYEPGNASDYFLPTSAKVSINPNGYATRNGKMNFIVKISENMPTVETEVVFGEEIVWKKTLKSQKQLS